MDHRSGLFRQFFGTAAAVLGIGMLLMGYWVTAAIEDGVKDNATSITAMFVTNAITPLAQELSDRTSLSPSNRESLDGLLQEGLLKAEITLIQIWSKDGTIAYSNDSSIIGRSFNQTDGMKLALQGETNAEFDNVLDEMSIAEDLRTAPLLEIYSPIRSTLTNEVIGVAEFYAEGSALRAHLFESRLQSWLVVAGISLMMLTAMYLVVANGAETIAMQRLSLDEKVEALSGLLEENRLLSKRINSANLRLAELNESALRRISAELHDGPLQLLAYSGLRLEAVNPNTTDAERLGAIKQTVDDAMREIRQICRGLSLPEIDEWNLSTIVRTVIENHTKRTGIDVSLTLGQDLPSLPLAVKTCIYRFVQETLNNGAQHGSCRHQAVTVNREGNRLHVGVWDDGKGFDTSLKTKGLGLAGLRERVNALGGEFTMVSTPGTGTHVEMALPTELSRDIA